MTFSSDSQSADGFGPASWQTRWNLPGLPALTYRGGKYVQTLNRMLESLPAQTVGSGSGDGVDTAPPLAKINIDEHRDWTIAMLHAWAAVLQVLSFYEERIVNEGYLRTATKPRSILELARTIGYEPQPGVAASTYLAVTVLIGKDEPPRQVKIPCIAVQSVPAPGELPQIFETHEEFIAWSDWNALKPADESDSAWRQPVRKDDKSVRLDGIQSSLLPGAAIMIVEDRSQSQSAQRRWLFTSLKTVQPNPGRGYTEVTWEDELGIDWSSGPLRHPQVYVFRQLAAVWGYAQGGVYYAPNDQANWAPISIGLPHAPISALSQSATGALFAGTAKGLYRSSNQGESWQALPIGLTQQEVLALTTNEQGHLFAGSSDGGIYLSQDHGDNWRVMSGETVVIPPTGLAKLLPHPNPPLPKTIVRALATSKRGKTSYVVAGTDNGVFLSADQGRTWKPTNRDFSKTDAKTGSTSIVTWSLAVTKQGSGEVFAGTDEGVLHIRRERNWLSFTAIVVVIALILALLLGSVNLVATLESAGQSLLHGVLELVKNSLNQLSGIFPAASSLAELPQKITLTPFAGLEQSITQALPQWNLAFIANVVLIALVIGVIILGIQFIVRRLSQRPGISLGMPVHALVVGKDGQLFAGTEKGVFRSNDNQSGNLFQRIRRDPLSVLLGDLHRRWQAINTGLTSQDVRALTFGPQAELVAGTQDAIIFRSTDNGATWENLSDGLSLKSVRAVQAAAGGCFAVGVPIDTPIDRAWSYFQLKKSQIDLDRIYTSLVPDGWIMLQNGGRSPAPFHVQTVMTADSPEPAKPGKFTRIAVEPATGLSTFDRTTTVILAQSERLPVYTDVPVEKNTLTLNRFVPGLKPGNKLIVSGKRMRVRLVDPSAANLKLVSDDGFQSTLLTPGDVYQVIRITGIRSTDTDLPDIKQWQLRDKRGFIGTVTLPTDAISLMPAADNDETVSELAVIEQVSDSPSATMLQLETPLTNFYDRSTVTIYGNVVLATHGQTVADELLGTSETMAASQNFLLKQQPLTFTSAASATGIASTLSIRINGVEWEEVSALSGLPLDRRAYMIRRDVKGNTDVIFGDGQEGAGIPSGIDQITATYRIGLGRAGNVPAGRLNLLQGLVAGATGAVSDIKAVTNPMEASGGTDPETMDTARWRAPLPVHHLQRIVSFTDFEDFAQTFAGIAKAKISKISAGNTTLLHLTIAGADGAVVHPKSELYVELINAIETYRASPTPTVQVDSFEPLYFNVKATLIIEPDQRARKDDIQAEAENALRVAFSFDRREFGQSVAAAEVITVLQNIRGVFAVELSSFYVRETEAQLNASLEAHLARADRGQLYPAQMLLINPTPLEGIVLEIAP